MFGSILNDEVTLKLAGYDISGVSSVDFSYSNSSNIVKPLGSKRGLTTVAGNTSQNMSLSRHLIYDDPVLDYTGSSNISGLVRYNGNKYEFSSGYLTSYSVNCAVGSVPKVNSNFLILDELTYSASGAGDAGSDITDIYIPSQGSISITCDQVSSNRVIGFDYSITMNRKPHYTIGSEGAVAVELIPPLEYSAQVQIEVDSAGPQDAYNFLTTRENKTVSFDIDGREGDDIQALTIPNATLVSESLSASENGSVVLNLNYIGHGF